MVIFHRYVSLPEGILKYLLYLSIFIYLYLFISIFHIYHLSAIWRLPMFQQLLPGDSRDLLAPLGYSLLVTGHSLGASTACLVTRLLYAEMTSWCPGHGGHSPVVPEKIWFWGRLRLLIVKNLGEIGEKTPIWRDENRIVIVRANPRAMIISHENRLSFESQLPKTGCTHLIWSPANCPGSIQLGSHK